MVEFANAHAVFEIPHHASLRFAARNSEMKYCVALRVLLANHKSRIAFACGMTSVSEVSSVSCASDSERTLGLPTASQA
jgi:hypothetical protein